MNYLIGFALLFQTLDAMSSCDVLARGGKELNPILGNSCKSVITRKLIIGTVPLFISNKKFKKVYLSTLIVSGGIGFTFNIAQ